MSIRTEQFASANPLHAILFMVAAGIINSGMLSMIKHLSLDLHPFEIGFFRCMIGFLVLLPIIWRSGGLKVMRTDRLGLHVVRGVFNVAGMLMFFWALSISPLATVSAIGFTAPLFAALLAIPLLGEKVGIRRWSGLIIGFIGAVVILRPGAGFVDFGALIAVASSAAWAAAMICIKRLTATEGPLAITAWAAFLVGLFALVPAIFVWDWPTGEQWFLLLIIGTLGSAVQLCFAKAFSLADTTVVLPFDFLKLIWASIFGFVLFSEVPHLWTWIGGSVIFASTVYIAYRERIKKPAQPRPRDEFTT